jgi:hypothetical protein
VLYPIYNILRIEKKKFMNRRKKGNRKFRIIFLGIGDWGLGIGDWGLGPIPNPQSPIPNPQSPLN